MRGAFTSGRTDRRDDASRLGAPRVEGRGGGEGERDDRAVHAASVRPQPPARADSANNHAMRASAVLIAIVVAACASSAPAPVTPTEETTPLPSLTLPLLAGGSWSSTSARGSVLVIDVWASWCKPCSKGFPRLDALARRSDVRVVAVTIDEDAAAARSFLAQFPLAVPVAHDADQVVTRPPLGIAQLPTVLIVDADGTIRHRLVEPSEGDYDRLGDLVDRLAR
jgi:thiol-disulfide isomerase/thioredoxin